MSAHPNESTIAVLCHLDGDFSVAAGSGTPLNATSATWVSPSSTWGQAFQSSSGAATSPSFTYDLNNTDFTIECRIWCGDNPNTAILVAIRNGTAMEYGFTIQGLGGIDYDVVIVHAGFGDYTTIQFAEATWVHVALTRSNDVIKFWVNGQLAYTTTSPGRGTVGAKTLDIMADDWSTFGSAIDELCISKQCLYTNTFTPNATAYNSTYKAHLTHPNPTSIVALYEFNDSTSPSIGACGSLRSEDQPTHAPFYTVPLGAWGKCLAAGPNTAGYTDYRVNEIIYTSPKFNQTIFNANSDFTLEGRIGTYDISLGPSSNDLRIDLSDFGPSITNMGIRRVADAVHGNLIIFGISPYTYTHQDSTGLDLIHVAITKQGNTVRFFANGILVHSFTVTINNPTYAWAFNVVCRRDDIRGGVDYICLSSTCLYTSNFTPPTTPYSGISYYSGLLVSSENTDTISTNISTAPPLCPDVAALYNWTATATAGIAVSNGSGSPTVSITAMSQSVDTGEITMIGTRTGYPTITWTISVLKTRLLMPSGTIASTIPPINLFTASASGGTATAQVRFNTDGSIELNSGAGFYSFGKWFNPIGGTPGLNYEIFLNGTWNSLSSPVTYSVSATGVGNVLSGTILIAANGARSNILGSVNLYLYAYGTP